MKTTKIIPVSDLEVGMYVAQLDRPWLETPFLFQGFYIRDQDEIKELRAHCENVHITCESLPSDLSGNRTDHPASAPVNGSNRKQKVFSLRSLFSFSRRDDSADPVDVIQTNVIYEEQCSLRGEMKAATGVHRQATKTVQNVMKKLEMTGDLDVKGLEESVSPMVDSVLRNPAALACLMRLQQKNSYLYHHSLASSVWATILGRQIGLSRDDIDVIALGAMLLDVGKTQVPNEILEKPEELNDEEKLLMRRHVQFGLDILEKAGDVDDRVLEMVTHHHERYNGTGYPHGLSGNEIPVFGRIAGIVDAYDAMITPRPYAPHVSSYDALRKLRVLADVEFQAEIVEQFTLAIGVFPTGTLVELNNGEVGIVTKQNAIRRLRPEIMVIMDAEKNFIDQFKVVDLNDETVTAAGDMSLWIENGLPPGAHDIDPTEYFLD